MDTFTLTRLLPAFLLAALCALLCASPASAKGTGPVSCSVAVAGQQCVPAACPEQSNGRPCKPKPCKRKHNGGKPCKPTSCRKHPKQRKCHRPPAPPVDPTTTEEPAATEACDKRCRSIADYLHNCERRIASQREFYPDLTPTMCGWPDYIDAFPQDLYDAAIAAWINVNATPGQLSSIEAASPDSWY